MSADMIKLAITVIFKFFKPKTFVKEASILVIYETGLSVYDQYMLGGVEAIDATTISALAASVWMLSTRCYQKYKDHKSEQV